jgi:membrane protein DedA with SNARE-associated domain
MPIESFLITIPPILVYVAVGLVIGMESLGLPLPGEIVLVASALLSSQHELGISPWGVAIGAATGAIIGDSIGYAIGRRFGKPLFERLGRRFPRHFGPHHVLFAERVFTRYGVYAVFFGRFVALLRILAGPLAGALRMQYRKFLAANVLGGIVWAGGTTAAIYALGIVAEVWLKRFSWIGLLVAILGGLTIGYLVKRKTERMARAYAEEQAAKPTAEEPARAGGSPGA